MRVKYLAAVAIASALTVGMVTTGCGTTPSGGGTPTQQADPCAANPCAPDPCAANPCAPDPCAATP